MKRWCRGALALAGLVLALEAACRLLVPVPVDLPREQVGGTVHLRPGARFTVAGEDFQNTVVANSQGFHDREHPAGKAPGTRRVLVLGDSMVEAVQVPVAQNLCSRLREHLGAEVLNMGIAGAGQAQELLVLREQGLRSAPDVVVLCVYASNDVFNNSPRLETKPGKPFFVERQGRLVLASGAMARVPEPWVETPLWRLSGLYRALVKAVWLAGQAGGARPHEVFAREASPAWREAWGVTRALLRALGEEARAGGARFLVVLLPGRLQVLPEAARALPQDVDWDLDGPHRELGQACRELGLECLDLAEPFRAAAREGTRLYFRSDEHLTAEGHALAARCLAEALREPKP